ncbi:hypothetical protein ACRTDU_11675 [Sunxiuqinia elliptica]
MRKTTTARIEETLDTVAEKIINLENTAKHLEIIKNSFSTEIKNAQNLKFELNTENIDKTLKSHHQRIENAHNKYLEEFEQKNKNARFIFYYFIIQLVVLIGLSVLTYHSFSKAKENKQTINAYYQTFIRDNSLEKTYIKWRDAK